MLRKVFHLGKLKMTHNGLIKIILETQLPQFFQWSEKRYQRRRQQWRQRQLEQKVLTVLSFILSWFTGTFHLSLRIFRDEPRNSLTGVRQPQRVSRQSVNLAIFCQTVWNGKRTWTGGRVSVPNAHWIRQWSSLIHREASSKLLWN